MRKRIVSCINKLITHERDLNKPRDFGIRVIIHIPAGFLIGLGLMSEKMFEFYERNEDAHHRDEAWKDVFGGMVGYVPGRALRYALIIWFLFWLVGRFS